MTKVPTPATALLTVMAAATPATLTLSGLTHTYSGNPQGAVVTTVPSGLSYSITYAGSTTARNRRLLSRRRGDYESLVLRTGCDGNFGHQSGRSNHDLDAVHS